jgi:hypothetical protein
MRGAMSRKKLGPGLVLAAALLSVAPAGAQTSLEVRSRVLFDQARALGEAGKWAEACPLFQASHDLHSTGGTALQLGNCYEKTGKPDRALAMYQLVLDDPKTAQNPERLRIAQERVAALRLQTGAAAPPREAPPPKEAPPHGAPPPNEAPKEAPAAPAPAPAPAPGAEAPSRVPAFVLFGVGGAGLVVGAVSGALALAQARKVNADCNGTRCPAADQPAADAAMAKGWVSNVGLGVGVAGVAVGAILLAVRRGPPPSVAPSAQGFVVRF